MQLKYFKTLCASDRTLKYLQDCHQCNPAYQPTYTIVQIQLSTSWPLTTLWVLLSWLVSALSTTAYVHPEWIVRETYPEDRMLTYDRDLLRSTLGMAAVCVSDRDKRGDLECLDFEEDFPSRFWQISYVLFGSGCVLLTWCSVLAFCSVWIVGKRNRQLAAVVVGRVQLVAAFLQGVSLLIYPMVLNSTPAKIHCDQDASAYSLSSCRLGWAYVAAITSTVLACHCPLLAHFSHNNILTPCVWTDI